MSCLVFVSHNRCPGKFLENQPRSPDAAKPKTYTCQHSMGKTEKKQFLNRRGVSSRSPRLNAPHPAKYSAKSMGSLGIVPDNFRKTTQRIMHGGSPQRSICATDTDIATKKQICAGHFDPQKLSHIGMHKSSNPFICHFVSFFFILAFTLFYIFLARFNPELNPFFDPSFQVLSCCCCSPKQILKSGQFHTCPQKRRFLRSPSGRP